MRFSLALCLAMTIGVAALQQDLGRVREELDHAKRRLLVGTEGTLADVSQHEAHGKLMRHEAHSEVSSDAASRAACIALWSGTQVLGSDPGKPMMAKHECHWSDIHDSEVSFLAGGPAPHMCVREYPDIVSNAVRERGLWEDCPPLASWWEFLPDRSSEGEFGNFQPQCLGKQRLPHRAKLYIDIGANIGSCLMPMVARPDVEAALAFEPSPKNLFYLTSSLLANPKLNDKVMLYPIALGNKDETQSIYSEKGNAGNTVIGQAVHTDSDPVGHVILERFDQVFKEGATPPYIHLMKIDAQGFEVKIMEGAKKLFASGAVNAVKFELATDWLAKQGTSSAEYMNTYLQHGFEIYDSQSKKLVTQEALLKFACKANLIKDFVAVRINKGQVATQKIINCEQDQ